MLLRVLADVDVGVIGESQTAYGVVPNGEPKQRREASRVTIGGSGQARSMR